MRIGTTSQFDLLGFEYIHIIKFLISGSYCSIPGDQTVFYIHFSCIRAHKNTAGMATRIIDNGTAGHVQFAILMHIDRTGKIIIGTAISNIVGNGASAHFQCTLIHHEHGTVAVDGVHIRNRTAGHVQGTTIDAADNTIAVAIYISDGGARADGGGASGRIDQQHNRLMLGSHMLDGSARHIQIAIINNSKNADANTAINVLNRNTIDGHIGSYVDVGTPYSVHRRARFRCYIGTVRGAVSRISQCSVCASLIKSPIVLTVNNQICHIQIRIYIQHYAVIRIYTFDGMTVAVDGHRMGNGQLFGYLQICAQHNAVHRGICQSGFQLRPRHDRLLSSKSRCGQNGSKHHQHHEKRHIHSLHGI